MREGDCAVSVQLTPLKPTRSKQFKKGDVILEVSPRSRSRLLLVQSLRTSGPTMCDVDTGG